MRILITGCDGFIARNLTTHLAKNHTVISTNRSTLNVLDIASVTQFFKKNSIDVVIHAAVSGGKRTKPDNLQTLIDNLKMFSNLSKNKDKFKALIHFGSGAEFDRRTDIILASEDEDSNPTDYYGLSKKIIKREIDKIDNFYNLRIFGCFGPDEEDTRFIKSSFQNIAKNKPIVIHQNRYMDFFSIDDLCCVTDFYISNFMKKSLPKDINLCYDNKQTLLDLAEEINNITGNKEIFIEKPGYYNEYTGNSGKIKSLKIDLFGLKEGLKRYVNVKKA